MKIYSVVHNVSVSSRYLRCPAAPEDPHTMERTALKQSQPCGSWEMKERLGMGGFGHVYLYQHLVSSDIRLYADETTDPDVSLAWFYSLSVFGAGVGREDRCETLPPGAELQEQRPLEQRDSDHEEVSVP